MRLFCFLFFPWSFVLFAQSSLVWTPDNAAQTRAQSSQSALTQNGVSAQTTTSLSGYSLNSFDYIFVCLGIHPNNYTLQTGDAEVSQLVDYLNNGGRLYMEGGDAWARDEQTALQRTFFIRGEADGKGDLAEINGAGCFSGHQFEYSGDNAYIDRLAPREGATLFFSNSSPGYGCGVGYENGTYRTLGLSFEFGGLQDGGDTKEQLMADLRTFFDAGCLRRKPAAMSLVAFSGYDGRVPLLWDAPPGQSSLSAEHGAGTDLVFHRDAMRKKKTRELRYASQKRAAQIQFYQASSYNIYRAPSENGPFTKIASSVDRQFYCDATVTSGAQWFYAVTANYGADESEQSIVASAMPATDGMSIKSPWVTAAPSLDGRIDESEWAWSIQKSIANPDGQQSVLLYIMNDDNYLYIGIDDRANIGLVTDDQIGLYFDDNFNCDWPTSALNEEGNFWFSRNGGGDDDWFRGLAGHWPTDVIWANAVTADGATSASSTAASHVQYEIRIDLQNSRLDALPGDSIGLFVYSLDRPDSTFTAAWPGAVMNTSRQNAWLVPALFGRLVFGQQGDCRHFSDNEDVSARGQYVFNENQDGHHVELDVTSLSGAGDMFVEQSNCTFENLPGKNALPLFWEVTADEQISSFSTDMTFHYTDDDASGFSETDSYFGMAWFNESANAWQWLGGQVDADANTVMIQNVEQTGIYILFRQMFGDSNGDGYVDEADLQQFADVWLDANSGEFDEGTKARFHNYNKNVNAAGEQIIDEGDLQVFSDNWLLGVQP